MTLIGQYFIFRGEEPESSERSGNEDNGDCTGEDLTGDGKDLVGKHDAKHKRKKHKHRSKHRKHKHPSPDDKDRRHKHRHKHKKRKRKDSAKGADAVDSFVEGEEDLSPSSMKRPRLDDLAVLEDLEKQRAMIQAELDNELMEGRVHSGMGLILQGYNSGSEDDGEFQERVRNGEQPRGQVGTHLGREAGRSRWDFTDEATFGSRRRSRSKSRDREVKQQKDERRRSRSEAESDNRHQEKARRRSQERTSRGVDQSSKERRMSAEKVGRRSQSPEAQPVGSTVKRPSSPSTKVTPEEQKSTRSKSSERSSRSRERRSRSRDWRAKLPESEKERDRDKRPAKSPTKETSSGKENRSPIRMRPPSPRQHSTSPRRREHHSPQRADRRSAQSSSTSRHRSPGRRGRSRSQERRRREGDRPRLSPVRYSRD